MNINEMQTAIIRRFGFEHPATLYFFGECERMKDILNAYKFAMNWKDEEEDEE